MIGPRYYAVTVALVGLIVASPAASQVELRFQPDDQHVAVGESGSLSVMLDDVLEVRTIELWVSFDPTLVSSLGCQPGQLYDDSGCSLFPFFDENAPGAWYGGCVTLGLECFTTGPGELLRWNFEGIDDGICPVQVDSLVLYDTLADPIEGVSLAGTTVIVGIVSSADTPTEHGLNLDLAPNPFNARTNIRFGGQENERVSVEVFDLRGHRLVKLWEGVLGPEQVAVQWDGTDGRGRPVPGGTYLFRILGQENRLATMKGLLLK